MKIRRKNLRNIIKNILKEVFQSHTYEPYIGDVVSNINPGCVHYGSEGTVTDVLELAGSMGKAVKYRVSNNGKSYREGQVLTKTMDQLQAKERLY